MIKTTPPPMIAMMPKLICNLRSCCIQCVAGGVCIMGQRLRWEMKNLNLTVGGRLFNAKEYLASWRMAIYLVNWILCWVLSGSIMHPPLRALCILRGGSKMHSVTQHSLRLAFARFNSTLSNSKHIEAGITQMATKSVGPAMLQKGLEKLRCSLNVRKDIWRNLLLKWLVLHLVALRVCLCCSTIKQPRNWTLWPLTGGGW